MSEASDYLEDKLCDHVCGTTSYTMPTDIYVKLHIGDPGTDGTGNAAAETTRVITGTMGAASSGVSTNDADIDWVDVSNTETYSHYTIWDHLTAGNCLLFSPLDATVAVTAGDNFTIAAGNLTVTVA